MFFKTNNVKFTLIFLLIVPEFKTSSAILYIVRQNCTRGAVFTPQPSTVNNICLQCVCVMPNISYCKILIVQLSIICSAAIVATATAATTAATTTTTTRTTTVVPTVTVPTIPAATATTAIGINPRASTPATSAMINAIPTTLMVNGTLPMIMMMMAAAGTAGMTMVTATMAPVPAG